MAIEITHLSNALISKTKDSTLKTFQLGIMAGIYISLGAISYSLITTLNKSDAIRLLGAFSFTIGLILVIFRKAQLFTGNNLLFINLFNKELGFKTLFKNWNVVYLGNFIGSIIMVIIIHTLFKNSPHFIINMSTITLKKVNYSFEQAYSLAILCNVLVCIAVFFGVALKKIWHKIIGIIIPITMFVFLGFEHSIANMFFMPLGLSFSEFSLMKAMVLFLSNILPVTLGNITGGFIISFIIYYIKDYTPSQS